MDYIIICVILSVVLLGSDILALSICREDKRTIDEYDEENLRLHDVIETQQGVIDKLKAEIDEKDRIIRNISDSESEVNND